jgi:hypothetical protein
MTTTPLEVSRMEGPILPEYRDITITDPLSHHAGPRATRTTRARSFVI